MLNGSYGTRYFTYLPVRDINPQYDSQLTALEYDCHNLATSNL